MTNPFFDHPILNSPYAYPARHWELDAQGQPTQQMIESRRRAEFITPIPQPRKRKGSTAQQQIVFDEGQGLSTQNQQYDYTAIISAVRQQVDQWRSLPNPNHWQVTPETAYHAFRRRERMELSKGGRSLLQGRGAALNTLETEGQVLQRVMPDLMGMKNILVINDEAHHCYREKPDQADNGDLKGDDKKEAEKNNEAARVWISGLEVLARKLGVTRLIDLSATPFFLRGSSYDEHGNPLGRPRTLLIDSEQLESGNKLDDNFRTMAADEIDRFRREIIERTGDRQQAEHITDQELLREVMNTVGTPDRLSDSIRCVVSVAMLTEGWDTHTVTHVLGVRTFGTQLVCEQVIGRALRRQSYDLNEEGLFNVEYADVLGVPFDFTAKPGWLPHSRRARRSRSKPFAPNAITWRYASHVFRGTASNCPRNG
jgi:hypothetical protein